MIEKLKEHHCIFSASAHLALGSVISFHLSVYRHASMEKARKETQILATTDVCTNVPLLGTSTTFCIVCSFYLARRNKNIEEITQALVCTLS